MELPAGSDVLVLADGTRLTATTLRDNQPARALLRRFGFEARACQDELVEHEVGFVTTPLRESV